MKKLLIVVAVAGLSGMLLAEQAKPASAPEKALTPEQIAKRKATARRLNERIEVPNSQRGKFLFANADEKNVPRVMIDIMMKAIAKHLDIAYEVVPVKEASPSDATKKLRENAAAAGVFIVYDKNLPSLLAAPEDNWAMLNVRALMTDGIEGDALTKRITGELYRAFMAASGAIRSQYPGNLMGISSMKEVDDLPEFFLPFDVFQRIEEHYAHIGLSPRKYVRYMNAVREGWAPAPTNDVQREIVELYKKRQAKLDEEKAAAEAAAKGKADAKK